MTSYEKELAVASNAARLASKLCLAVRSEMLRSPSSMEKSGREPVTIADYGAQAAILAQISSSFPDDGSLAEERANEFNELTTEKQRERVLKHLANVLERDVTLDDVTRWLDFGRDHGSSRIWVVDPIDGTKGFLRGDQFAIAVALLVDGEPVVGAIACPLLPFGATGAADRGVLAAAVRSAGTTLEPLTGQPSRSISVSDQSDINQTCIVESVEIEHTDHGWSQNVLDLAGVGGQPVRIDSQAKYVIVADGRAEIYIRNSKTGGYRENVWDHAAGALIVEEAGGTVTDLDGKDLDFSLGVKLDENRGILATNGIVHQELLDAIQKHEN